MLNLVILGPSGAGKGTQAERVSKRYGIYRISTGELLREGIKEETDLGKKAKEYVRKGILVPDPLMLELIKKRLGKLKNGFLLDGFPRTLPQGEGLEEILKEARIGLSGVLSLKVGEETLIRRLSHRRICSRCGTPFNLATSPSREEGKCDRCGGSLIQREDDREEIVIRRLRVYQEKTSPLEEYYRRKNLLYPMEGEGGIREVEERMERVIQKILEGYGKEKGDSGRRNCS
ncbi:adenylate kinase [candidate division TA06 bacterium]|nr:adenylate kinase [candidate division TA06 bacterium]